MARMLDGGPFSVPDPLGDAWDDMVRRNRVLQARNDPFFAGADGQGGLSGGAGADRLAAPPAPPAPAAPVDPRQTDVFRRGPDGKLHPIPGWRTTGPFDFGTWAHNIDWGGVARDAGHIAAGIATHLAPEVGVIPKIAGYYLDGEDTLKDLQKPDSRLRP